MQNEQVKRESSDPKKELLSSIGLFIGTGLLHLSNQERRSDPRSTK